MKLQEVIKQIEDGTRRRDNMGVCCDYFKINDEMRCHIKIVFTLFDIINPEN